VFKVGPEEQIAAVTALSNAVTSRGFPVAGDEQNLSAEKAGQVVNNTVHRAVAMLEPGAVRDYLMTPTSSTLMSDTDRLAFERACNTLDIDSAKQELYARMVGYSLQQQEQKNPATCASLRAEGNRDKNRAMIMMARVMQVLDEGGAIAPEHYQELAQAMEDYKMLELLPPGAEIKRGDGTFGISIGGHEKPNETDPEKIQRSNEDAMIAGDGYAAVFDGMGGMGGDGAGRQASQMLAQVYGQGFAQLRERGGTLTNTQVGAKMKELFIKARNEARSMMAGDSNLERMNATGVAIFEYTNEEGEQQVALIHRGDSRLYHVDPDAETPVTKIIRDSQINKPRIQALWERLTDKEKGGIDHFSQMEEIKDKFAVDDAVVKQIDEDLDNRDGAYWPNTIDGADDGKPDPYKYLFNLVRSKNNATYGFLDHATDSSHDSKMQPHVFTGKAETEGFYVLTSDGVHDNLTQTQTMEILSNPSQTPQERVVELTRFAKEQALNLENPRHKDDDITAVLLDLSATDAPDQQDTGAAAENNDAENELALPKRPKVGGDQDSVDGALTDYILEVEKSLVDAGYEDLIGFTWTSGGVKYTLMEHGKGVDQQSPDTLSVKIRSSDGSIIALPAGQLSDEVLTALKSDTDASLGFDRSVRPAPASTSPDSEANTPPEPTTTGG